MPSAKRSAEFTICRDGCGQNRSQCCRQHATANNRSLRPETRPLRNSSIGRVIDPVNRLAKVWVKLDKPAPADRYIGMQVDVKVDSPRSASPAVKSEPKT